jgi:hypothetical protein
MTRGEGSWFRLMTMGRMFLVQIDDKGQKVSGSDDKGQEVSGSD